MSEFSVNVCSLIIEPHPGADKLELARIGDYRSVVGKGQFKTGDLAAYVPEASIIPSELLKQLGLEGKLAGKDKSRVKAVRLRGILSQGICIPALPHWSLGDDVAKELGIIKWEPPIPSCLSGEVWNAGGRRCIRYDIENIKKHPDVLQDGEEVVFTEKIHGTWCQLGWVSSNLSDDVEGRLVVASKGLGSQGLAFKNNDKNKNNLYIRIAKKLKICNDFFSVKHNINDINNSVFILGEIFGFGIQDLGYGYYSSKDETIGFRVFDIYIGQPGLGRYLNDNELNEVCEILGLVRVPVLYRGPFSKEIMWQYTSGKETVSGKELHIREGIVIRPTSERTEQMLGRVQLKSVSENYLLRDGNTSEYQ